MYQEFLESFLTELAKCAMAFLATLLALAIAQLLRWARVKVGEEKMKIVETVVRLAVASAEQSHLAGLIDDKKEYALQLSSQWLAKHKIAMSPEEIGAIIESAVHELNQWYSAGRAG